MDAVKTGPILTIPVGSSYCDCCWFSYRYIRSKCKTFDFGCVNHMASGHSLPIPNDPPAPESVPYFLSAEEKCCLPPHILSVVRHQESAINLAYLQLAEVLSKLNLSLSTCHCDLSTQDIESPTVIPDRVELSSRRLKGDLPQKCAKGVGKSWGPRHQFAWAWFTVNTRAVYLSVDPRDVENGSVVGEQPAGESLALAPYLDLLNHSGSVAVQAGINIHQSGPRQILF